MKEDEVEEKAVEGLRCWLNRNGLMHIGWEIYAQDFSEYVLFGEPLGNGLVGIIARNGHMHEIIPWLTGADTHVDVIAWYKAFYNLAPSGCWMTPDKIRTWRGTDGEIPEHWASFIPKDEADV